MVAIDIAVIMGLREYGLIGAAATLIVFVDASSAIEVVNESLKQR
jgi:hypothetical protein